MLVSSYYKKVRDKGPAVRKIAKDTTIEFRIHQNTLDMGRLYHWSNVLCALVDWAVNSSYSDAEALPKSALAALVKIAPNEKKFILRRIRQWRKAVKPKNRMISVKGGVWQLTKPAAVA